MSSVPCGPTLAEQLAGSIGATLQLALPLIGYGRRGVDAGLIEINPRPMPRRQTPRRRRLGAPLPVTKSSTPRRISMYFAVTKAYASQGDAQVLLVSTDEAGLDFRDERHCRALCAGARRATDPMQIGLAHRGYVEIEDVGYAGNVESAGRQVGCNHDADGAAANSIHRLLAVQLGQLGIQVRNS